MSRKSKKTCQHTWYAIRDREGKKTGSYLCPKCGAIKDSSGKVS